MEAPETNVSYRLRKPCKLRHKALVDPLFGDGDSLYAYPLRLVWRSVDGETLQKAFRPGFMPKLGKVQMLISVPKRKLKRAVDRVLMRRRIREAYRHLLPEFEAVVERYPIIATLSLGVVFIASKPEPYDLVERKLAKLLTRLVAELQPSEEEGNFN